MIYVYTAWVVDNRIPPQRGAIWGVVLVGMAVAIAYASLKLYDEPMRRWLGARFLTRNGF
ncbi:hypothetical protein [Sphingomonas faeni]|uniref:hypothetical protein n=1 Tax=Sphingomonas faeni TaxID=185950 RepID=UPI0020C830ED|nr:hypothetical protein [Sphingomonas faeni]MCP8890190.1 hypothetical protein [Sphingomonas faeni]